MEGRRPPSPSPGRPAAPPAAVAPCGASSLWALRPPSAPCPHLRAGRGEAGGPSPGNPQISPPAPTPGSPRACADEEDVVVAIGGGDTVHGNAGEGVGHGRLQEEGAVAVGQHGVVHQRVMPSKLDHLVREVLGGAEGAEGFAGALRGSDADSAGRGGDLLPTTLGTSIPPAAPGGTSPRHVPCPDEGTARGPGRTPTGSWDPPCARRGPGKPGGCQPWCRRRWPSPGKQSWRERERTM